MYRSALYLDGVKLGDQQMMTSGLLSAAMFLFMSHAKPLTNLAPRRPPATIINTYMAITVFLQVNAGSNVVFLGWSKFFVVYNLMPPSTCDV